jgi:murein hydrolase activator
MSDFLGMMILILRKTGFWSALVIALLSTQYLARAETPDEAKAKLGTVEQSLQDSIAKQSSIAADIDAAVKAQNDISDQLIALAKTLQDQEQVMARADQRVQKLESEAIIIRSDLAAKQDVLSELLAGLQRLQENPPPALVVDPHDVLQALRGAMMFGAVVPDMRAQAEELQGQLQRLADIRIETETEKKNQNAAIAAVQASQVELNALQLQKKQFALTAGKDLASEKQRSLELADQAKTLKQLLASLEAEQIALEKQKTAEAKAREDAEKLKIAESQRPLMVFSMSKGKLAYPVQGDILKQYGEDNGLGRPLDGIAVATQAGLNVTSPIDGKVEFAGPFRSYGQLLILNAGEGYLVLLAGMKQITVEIGQSVRAGEPVGSMGDGPSSVALIGGLADIARPVLYVEFRKESEPVDPSPWWIGGRKEAMR